MSSYLDPNPTTNPNPKVILHATGLSTTSHELTLGIMWESNLMAHKKSIQDVLSTAQGEQALEHFLRDLRLELWLGLG
jgi:hypothetical protein